MIICSELEVIEGVVVNGENGFLVSHYNTSRFGKIIVGALNTGLKRECRRAVTFLE